MNLIQKQKSSFRATTGIVCHKKLILPL